MQFKHLKSQNKGMQFKRLFRQGGLLLPPLCGGRVTMSPPWSPLSEMPHSPSNINKYGEYVIGSF